MWNVSPLLFFSVSPSIALGGVAVWLAPTYCVDGRGVAAHSPCRLRCVVVSCNDFAVGGQLLHGSGVVLLASPFSRAVVDVVLTVAPFQVVGSVVGIVFILVVHVEAFTIAWHKGTGYEAMHEVAFVYIFASHLEAYRHIASKHFALLEDAPFAVVVNDGACLSA